MIVFVKLFVVDDAIFFAHKMLCLYYFSSTVLNSLLKAILLGDWIMQQLYHHIYLLRAIGLYLLALLVFKVFQHKLGSAFASVIPTAYMPASLDTLGCWGVQN